MATDLLLPLMDLPGVAESVTSARERVDALLWDRSLRTKGAALRKDVAIQNARASAMPRSEWSPPRPLAMSWKSAAT